MLLNLSVQLRQVLLERIVLNHDLDGVVVGEFGHARSVSLVEERFGRPLLRLHWLGDTAVGLWSALARHLLLQEDLLVGVAHHSVVGLGGDLHLLKFVLALDGILEVVLPLEAGVAARAGVGTGSFER